MSFDEKHKLSIDIDQLSGDHLSQALIFIKSREPSSIKDNQNNIEIDFQTLKLSTLRELQTYVASCQRKPYKIPIKENPELTKRIKKQYDILFGGQSPIEIKTTGKKNSTEMSGRLSASSSSDSGSSSSTSSTSN